VEPRQDAKGRLITPEQLAEWLGVSTNTLAQWRVLKKGPPYAKIVKRVRYDSADVQRWIDQQKETTSGPGKQARAQVAVPILSPRPGRSRSQRFGGYRTRTQADARNEAAREGER
jgi:predicted DNA-binding transcriptional regulator AlpA